MACTTPASGSVADDYFQCLINEASDGDIIVIPTQEYILDGNVFGEIRQVEINKSLTIDFNGSLIRFAELSGTCAELRRKGFIVVPVVPRREYTRVIFKNGRFIGDTTAQTEDQYKVNFGPVITSTSGTQIAGCR